MQSPELITIYQPSSFTHLSSASYCHSANILVIGDSEQKLLGNHSGKEDKSSVTGIFIAFFQPEFADSITQASGCFCEVKRCNYFYFIDKKAGNTDLAQGNRRQN